MQSTSEWARLNFGGCELGDKRRTKRLVQVAEEVANNPSASLPGQIERWGDLKAAYRLFDRDEVSFEAIADPHWKLTQQAAKGRTLVIGDTTEIDFGRFRQIEGVGPTGNGSGQGFLLHNALMVNADSEEIIGVAGQTIHYRKKKTSNKRPNASQRLKAERESQVWGAVIDQIGEPSAGVEYVHVFDRGADNFEVYCHLLQQRGEWVVRASKMSRYVLTEGSEEPVPLKNYLLQLDLLGSYALTIRSRDQQPAREAQLEVRVGLVKIPGPRHVSPWVRELQQPPIAMNVLEVVEVNVPPGVTPIRWVLFTSLPVKTFRDAWAIIGYYELRWLVEEYHKALKTGCRTESRQLKAAGRLEALVALTSVVALRLLQLKSLAHESRSPGAARRAPRVARNAEAGPQKLEPRSRPDRWTVLPRGRKTRRLPRPQK